MRWHVSATTHLDLHARASAAIGLRISVRLGCCVNLVVLLFFIAEGCTWPLCAALVRNSKAAFLRRVVEIADPSSTRHDALRDSALAVAAMAAAMAATYLVSRILIAQQAAATDGERAIAAEACAAVEAQ